MLPKNVIIDYNNKELIKIIDNRHWPCRHGFYDTIICQILKEV